VLDVYIYRRTKKRRSYCTKKHASNTQDEKS
jgi:hypothetical protein